MQGNLVPLYERVMADQLTPVLAYRCLVKEDDREAPSFLFESVTNGSQQVRPYSLQAPSRRQAAGRRAAGRRAAGCRLRSSPRTGSAVIGAPSTCAALLAELPYRCRTVPPVQGRYSFVGATPALEVVARGQQVHVMDHRRGTRDSQTVADPMQVCGAGGCVPGCMHEVCCVSSGGGGGGGGGVFQRAMQLAGCPAGAL